MFHLAGMDDNKFHLVNCVKVSDLRKTHPFGFDAQGEFSGDTEVDLRGSTTIQQLQSLDAYAEDVAEESAV